MTSQSQLARVLVSGAGFLADAYDLFVINVAVDMMRMSSYHQHLSNNIVSLVKSTALIG